MSTGAAATFARGAVGHPGQFLALAGGLGYLLGYTNMRVAAAGLGVGPADLGLTTNDYLVSAVFWALLIAPLAAGYAWLQRLADRAGWRSWTGVSTAGGAAGTALVSVWSCAMTVSWRWALLMAMAIAIAAAAAWWLAGPGLAVVATIGIAVFGFGPPTSFQWGTNMRLDPAATSVGTAPVWLELVLPSEEGFARFSDGSRCVVRMSDRVYVTRATVRVEPSAVAFRTADCLDGQ